MYQKHFAILLSATVLVATLCFSSVTHAQTTADTATIEKARAVVEKVGVGTNSRVEVKLLDKTKLKGYVSTSEPDSFTLNDARTGSARTISYAQVAQVKKQHSGLSARTWMIIGGAVAAAIIIGVTVVKPVVCDGGAQTRGLC